MNVTFPLLLRRIPLAFHARAKEAAVHMIGQAVRGRQGNTCFSSLKPHQTVGKPVPSVQSVSFWSLFLNTETSPLYNIRSTRPETAFFLPLSDVRYLTKTTTAITPRYNSDGGEQAPGEDRGGEEQGCRTRKHHGSRSISGEVYHFACVACLPKDSTVGRTRCFFQQRAKGEALDYSPLLHGMITENESNDVVARH